MAIIMVTHDIENALREAKHILCVDRADGEGQVLQERFVLVAERDVLAREDDGRFIHSLSPFLSAS